MQGLCIQVFGKVQGVWFRKGTMLKAKELKLKGTVQNMSDGSVKIHAFGNQEQIKQLLKWCENGTPHAQVDRLSTTEISFQNKEAFIILR